MLKRIRKDTTAEQVAYPFILVLAFVLILAFILSGVYQYITAGTMAQGLYPGMTMPFGLSNYTTIAADSDDPRFISYGDTEGYQISDDDVLDEIPYPTHCDPFMFEDDDGDDKYVHIIRNNVRYDPTSTDMWEMYLDFVAVRRHTGSGPGAVYGDWNNAAIPFSAIQDNWWNTTNVSITEFQLSGSQDNLFVNATYGGEANFTAALWDNDFRLFYGWSLFRLNEVDFWGAIAMLIYADIPGVDDTVDWFIHAFVIAVIVFVVFTMAVRMTPFLGGD